MACDPQGNDAMFPVTGDDDLVAAGLSPEHDDDGHDTFAVFDDATRGTQPAIDVDAVDAGATGTGTVDSNTHSNYTGVNGNADGNGTRTPSSGAVSGLGKRAGVTLRRFMRRLMVSMCVLELYVRCVELC